MDSPHFKLLDLPDEILLHIFKKATQLDKLNLSATNKRLNGLSFKREGWDVVKIQADVGKFLPWLEKRSQEVYCTGYLVAPLKVQDRTGDYKSAEKVQAVWEPLPAEDWVEGGSTQVKYNPWLKKAYVPIDYVDYHTPGKGYYSLFEVISSPLVMYRLRCLFPECYVNSEDGYKSVWSITLKHKELQKKITLGEHKGAVTTWIDEELAANGQGRTCITQLIELVLSNDCPHPYDGTVAGSVA